MQIRKAILNDLGELSSFLTKLQKDSTHHICSLPIQRNQIESYLHESQPRWPKNVFLAYREKRLIGFIRIVPDTELGRARIEGPLVDDTEWDTVAENLYLIAVESILSKEIKDHEICGNISNKRLNGFACRHGFVPNPNKTIQIAIEKERLSNLPDVSDISELTPRFHKAFIQLHDAIFPKTSHSGKQILEMLSDKKKVFIGKQNDILLGYIYIILDQSTNEGYIDFLGVVKSARRQGIGTKLIIKGIKWLFTSFDVDKVMLYVTEENEGAYELYNKIGFKPLRWILGYRKIF
ncbi:MAG: GNAT family N-acetyltransferase [Promethearchaeota archaeon]